MSGKIEGTVIQVSDGGDLLSDISAQQLADVPRDERVAVSCGGHQTIGIFAPDHAEPELTFLAILDEERLRLTIVGDSTRAMLGLDQGERVVVEWQ